MEALARAGVGRIRVIDGDTFSESNLNRQVLATRETIGRKKVEIAAERVNSIDPEIQFEGIDELITEDNIESFLKGFPDVLIDAIDTVEHKVSLLRQASSSGIPTFSSMGAALRTDPRMIKIAPLKKTKVCPLAATVRSKLRDCDTSEIVCVYSEEEVRVTPSEKDAHGKSVLGSLPTIPAIFGMTLANEAILRISECKRP